MRFTFTSLANLLKRQAVYVAFSLVVAAIFWAIGQEINPLTILVYSICLGNLTEEATTVASPLYFDRRFPYNWLAFALVLAVLAVPIYVISSTLVWWIAPPSRQALGHYLLTGWKFPILITVVFSVGLFFYETTKKRLELRNWELQNTLAQGAAQLQQQEQELARARDIQQSLLPRRIPQIAGFDVAAAWKPARAVSGDYYDVFPLEKDKLCVCIADVVGKGVSAALLMANTQAAVRALAGSSANPARLCEKVNRLLCENLATGKFVTFFCGVLDGDARTFHYCNAGHPYPVLVTAGHTRLLAEGGAVLGVFPEWKYQEQAVAMNRGDRLLLFTDGITEASSDGLEEFGEERIADFARRANGDSAKEITERLLAEVSGFCEGRFQDDATLMTIEAR